MQNGNVLIPAGSTVRGVVSAVDPADRLHRAGSLTLSFDQMNVRGRSYQTRAMATNVFESGGIREEAGTIAATEGKDIELPAGSIIRIRFDAAITVR